MSSDHDDLSRWEAALEKKEEELLEREERLHAKEEELKALEASLKSQSSSQSASPAASETPPAASETTTPASDGGGWQAAGTTDDTPAQASSQGEKDASIDNESGDSASPGENLCATCKSALSYIDQYHRWYCYACKEYR